MTVNDQPDSHPDRGDEDPALPEHLASLVGSLQGPADLGRNHDKYLSYADRDQSDGAASA
ncbi:MAG: hypothetical protein ACRDOU_05850 [Streptosporangiaceae bacterium]